MWIKLRLKMQKDFSIYLFESGCKNDLNSACSKSFMKLWSMLTGICNTTGKYFEEKNGSDYKYTWLESVELAEAGSQNQLKLIYNWEVMRGLHGEDGRHDENGRSFVKYDDIDYRLSLLGERMISECLMESNGIISFQYGIRIRTINRLKNYNELG